jgi:hypothetical protein
MAPLLTSIGGLWLDPAVMAIVPTLIMVPPNGIATHGLAIPNFPYLRNRTLHLQAFHIAFSRPWSRLTNVASMTMQ